MTELRDERREREFARRLAEGFATTPLGASDRVAFGEALERRIAHRRRFRAVLGSALVLTSAAAIAWLAIPAAVPDAVNGPRPEVTPRVAATQPLAPEPEEAARATEDTTGVATGRDPMLFAAELLERSEIEEEDENLPDEYAAIAGAFLDG